MSPEAKYEEMILALDTDCYSQFDIPEPQGVEYGYYTGKAEELLEAVASVNSGWPQFFGKNDRVYCAFVDGKIASFCLIEDMGTHTYGGRQRKIGGPGCVGTVPEFRRRGIGLCMVRNATRILREAGYDISYIHYTGVAHWYARLGYQTVLVWNRDGIVRE